ncbi:MAG: hypothetical protein GXO09_04440 [Crenarchaeota archaeon]|nr:hypothetical protein [Thermoproteota archaeon]
MSGGMGVDGGLLEAFREALKLAWRLMESGAAEWRGLLGVVGGGYVEPGPSGCLERGAVDVLPTGRNMYTIDPGKLPTPSAWRLGVRAAREALEKARRLTGRYPETVGHILWSIDGFKAGGEQLAAILYMLGVRPRWGSGGRVEGLEPIPLEELGRPRIDVLVRISGIVRDALPNYIELINRAVALVVKLPEPPEENYPRKHFLEFLEKLGPGREEEALARVWGDPEGAYGAGVNYAVYSSSWRTLEDLGKVWARWSSTLYLDSGRSRESVELLLMQASKLDAIVRHHYTDEHDPTNCCCYYAYQGGMQALAEALGARPVNLVVDTARGEPTARTVGEELARILHAKLLNDRWIEGMMRHGYRGAAEIMKKVDHLYGWQATTRSLPDQAWNLLAEKLLSEKVRRWMRRVNPYALEEMTRRMMEAVERGLWRPSRKAWKLLLDARMEVEAVLEGEAGPGVQAGEVRVYAPRDVPQWAREMRVVEEAWRRVRRGG